MPRSRAGYANAFQNVVKLSNEYREARLRLEMELRDELEKRLYAKRMLRAVAVRNLHNAIISEMGKPNYAEIKRAMGTKDHNTVKTELELTDSEEVQPLIEEVSHPDDAVIRKDGDYYVFTMQSGNVHRFRLVGGEYVGVSPDAMDELDLENAIDRVAEWEERNVHQG